MPAIFDLVKALFTPDPPVDRNARYKAEEDYLDSNDYYAKYVTKGMDNVPHFKEEIQGYRADPRGRFGGTDGLETLPYKLDSRNAVDLYANTRAMSREKHLGIPQLSPQEIAAFVLKEGRGDMHMNDWDRNSPDLTEMNRVLKRQYSGGVADYLTALKEKSDVAKRHGITFAEAWNGTGVAPGTGGTTGKDYARGYQAFLRAADHPKNAELLKFIQSAIQK